MVTRLAEAALRELRRKGLIHGSRIQDLAAEIGARPDYAHRIMDALVAAGAARWNHPAPTRSQVAFLSLSYPQKVFRDELAARAPDFKACWYLSSTTRPECLDAPQDLDWCEAGDHPRQPDRLTYCPGCHG